MKSYRNLGDLGTIWLCYQLTCVWFDLYSIELLKKSEGHACHYYVVYVCAKTCMHATFWCTVAPLCSMVLDQRDRGAYGNGKMPPI